MCYVTLSKLADRIQKMEDQVAKNSSTAEKTAPDAGAEANQAAWMGVAVQPMTPAIANEIGLPEDQQGVLIQQIEVNSPADKAGLQGSYKPVEIDGQRVLVGGDMIISMDGQPIASYEALLTFVQNAKPGQEVKVAVLRDGKERQVQLTLGVKP